jgi:predicted ATPase
VSEWYRNNFGGWQVEVSNSRSPVYTIELINDRLPSNNILDTGFGIQQSLPIVVAAYRKYEKPTLVIIEEPETHLNPSVHAEIGQLLAISAKEDRDKRFLVETHSLNLMIRLRTLIAKGQLKIEDVALYYVDYDMVKSCSQLREVTIKENGEVENWPEHMFKETLREALTLRSAQMESKT